MLSETGPAREAFSSVELTRNTKGYQWVIKVYVPAGEEDTALPKLRELDDQLQAQYGAES
jgi:hypothetical protein